MRFAPWIRLSLRPIVGSKPTNCHKTVEYQNYNNTWWFFNSFFVNLIWISKFHLNIKFVSQRLLVSIRLCEKNLKTFFPNKTLALLWRHSFFTQCWHFSKDSLQTLITSHYKRCLWQGCHLTFLEAVGLKFFGSGNPGLSSTIV